MNKQLLNSLALISALALAPQVHARPNAGAPTPNGAYTGSTEPVSFEAFQRIYQERGARISNMRASETREANLISITSELGTYIVTMTSDSLTVGPQKISSEVSTLLSSFRKLKATSRSLPAGSPKLAQFQADLDAFARSMTTVDQASTDMNNTIDKVSSVLAGEQATVNSRYAGSSVDAATNSAVAVFSQLLSDYRDFNTYEKGCMNSIYQVQMLLRVTGLGAETSATVQDAEVACINQKSQINPNQYLNMKSQLQNVVSVLNANYRMIN